MNPSPVRMSHWRQWRTAGSTGSTPDAASTPYGTPSRCFFVLGVEMNHRALIAERHWDDGGSAWPVYRRKRSIRRRVAVVPPEVPLREGFKIPACLDGYYALT